METQLIRVKNDTYKRLTDRGDKPDTYDDIIRKLLDQTEPKKK